MANIVGEGGFSFQSEQLGKFLCSVALFLLTYVAIDPQYSITLDRALCGWRIFLWKQQPGDDQVSKKPKLQANLLLGVASVMLERKVLAMRTLRANLRAHYPS
jgi:hypothetical protein